VQKLEYIKVSLQTVFLVEQTRRSGQKHTTRRWYVRLVKVLLTDRAYVTQHQPVDLVILYAHFLNQSLSPKINHELHKWGFQIYIQLES